MGIQRVIEYLLTPYVMDSLFVLNDEKGNELNYNLSSFIFNY